MSQPALPEPVLARTAGGSGAGRGPLLAHGGGGTVAVDYGRVLEGLARCRTSSGRSRNCSGELV